ncbi:cytidine deaminase [Wallemia mellicola CBS 633.66]|uniref:Cytidine deaminase n=1 Tax=Wallemia mellicola (strain ATCC MYA-4683 / CBS 633.66) TaxID=671144 RepID=I4Y954_WALMC|nr:cytidine deaminase [Wallemia mellicola CBS 633.66]EIM20496.1 cytidine deaminase [Wallemia mellicola CBS 633.66]|eukprot:XP_006959522.1 cytidine deaminase [Wallemia mellicola CBS 633.66]
MTSIGFDEPELISRAFQALQRSYSPYSKFRVGAALVSTENEIFGGANVENASYGGAICAERTALVKAVSEGHKRFQALAVVSDLDEPITPCGICRQFIREFFSPETPILLVSQAHPANNASETSYKGPLIKRTNISVLLPDSFGPEQLDR